MWKFQIILTFPRKFVLIAMKTETDVRDVSSLYELLLTATTRTWSAWQLHLYAYHWVKFGKVAVFSYKNKTAWKILPFLEFSWEFPCSCRSLYPKLSQTPLNHQSQPDLCTLGYQVYHVYHGQPSQGMAPSCSESLTSTFLSRISIIG